MGVAGGLTRRPLCAPGRRRRSWRGWGGRGVRIVRTWKKMASSGGTRTKATPGRMGGREDAVRWARSLLSGGNFVVLDSETTGLGTPIDFVEVGVLSCRGETLFDSPMKPSCPVEPGASRVHGRTTESLSGERRFVEVYPDLLEALWAKRVVAYNAPTTAGCGTPRWGALGRGRRWPGSLPRGSARCAPLRPTSARGRRGAAAGTRSWREATTRPSGTRGPRCA